MKKILFSLLIILCFSHLKSFSQDGWKVYDVDNDSSMQKLILYYIDTSYSAKDQYGNPKVWTRIESYNILGISKDKGTITDFLVAIDCYQKRDILLQKIDRNPIDKSVIKQTKINPLQNDWDDVLPGSKGELFLQTACKLFSNLKE